MNNSEFTVNSTQEEVREVITEDLIRGWLDRYIMDLPRTQAEFLFTLRAQAGNYANIPANYNDYMQSNRWRDVRNTALLSYSHKCAVCGNKKDVHVHHRNYDSFGNENISDLVVVCRMCHFYIHPKAHMTKEFFISDNTWLLWVIFESIKMGKSIFPLSANDVKTIKTSLAPPYIAACKELEDTDQDDIDLETVCAFLSDLAQEVGVFKVSQQMRPFERRLAASNAAVIESPRAYLRKMCKA